MDVVEVDVDDNVEHVVENTPYITLVHTWRSRGVHHRPHTYDVCLAGRIRTRGQLHYSCHNDSWRGGRDTNDARRHIINNEGAHAADAAVRPSNTRRNACRRMQSENVALCESPNLSRARIAHGARRGA